MVKGKKSKQDEMFNTIFDDIALSGITERAFGYSEYSDKTIEDKIFDIFINTGKVVTKKTAIKILEKSGIPYEDKSIKNTFYKALGIENKKIWKV